MRNVIIISIFTICLCSCGVLLDETKLLGSWTLSEAEFYQYNKILDTYKIYTGTTGKSGSNTSPVVGRFFFTNSNNMTIKFEDNHQFEIKDNSSDTIIVSTTDTSWKVDDYNNSMKLTVRETVSGVDSIWLAGFKSSHKWPLSANEELELYIKAKDIGRDHFTITAGSATLNIDAMKATFTLKN